jgi:hypothetical protein
MTVYEQVIEAFPELAGNPDIYRLGIMIQNDSDGTGDYIAKWDYDQALPEELKIYLR